MRRMCLGLYFPFCSPSPFPSTQHQILRLLHSSSTREEFAFSSALGFCQWPCGIFLFSTSPKSSLEADECRNFVLNCTTLPSCSSAMLPAQGGFGWQEPEVLSEQMWNSSIPEIPGLLQTPCLGVSRSWAELQPSFREGCGSLLEWLCSDGNEVLGVRAELGREEAAAGSLHRVRTPKNGVWSCSRVSLD